MQTMLAKIKGVDISALNLVEGETFEIMLNSPQQNKAESEPAEKVAIEEATESKELEITVKKYMTEKSEPTFDFMLKWNKDIPMPLRTMRGTVEKETRGMVYMKLHGFAEATIRCMRCGRELTNPVSRMYGIGPECIHHVPIIFEIDMEDVASMTQKLQEVKWEGWIIKSAITEQREVAV